MFCGHCMDEPCTCFVKKVKGKISNWVAVYDKTDFSDLHFHIRGIMNGKPICTSRILSIVGNIAETRNSKYEIGIPMFCYYNEEVDVDLVMLSTKEQERDKKKF